MQGKNKTYFILMVSSILVMLIVQLLWLDSVYKDYQNSLKQETNLLFKDTVTAMLDSLLLRGLQPMVVTGTNSDSLVNGKRDLFFIRDSTKIIQIDIKGHQDSLTKTGVISHDDMRSMTIVTSRNMLNFDSLKGTLRPVVQQLDSLQQDRRFVLRLNEERLDTALVSMRFNEILRQNGYPIQAKVRKASRAETFDPLQKGELILDEIPIPPGIRLQAYFEDLNGYIFRKMLSPVVFSLLVTSLIGVSFYVMYRNMRKQEKLNLLKNELISNISHELKTPIATVSVVLESLQHFSAKDSEATKAEYIQIAKNELKRLTSLTESILKSTTGYSVGISEKQIDLYEIVTESLISFKPVLDQKGFEVNFKSPPGKFLIKGDEVEMSLIISNMLDNAIKYSKEEMYIEIELGSNERMVYIKIKDRGIGIPESYQKDIFEKFVRVPQKDLHDVKGYGLGLAQVSESVKKLKGKIELLSSPDKGSIFTLTFPKA